MEIKIESKRNNPLLNRTEVHFIIRHEGEKTPNREIIRSELADKLNAKKENIIVNIISSSFGTPEITGYAKVYSSLQKSKDFERKHILKRNKIGVEEKKKEEKKADETAVKAVKEGETKKPAEKSEPAEEVSKEEKTEESHENEKLAEEPSKQEEKPAEEAPKEETSEPEKSEKKSETSAELQKEESSNESEKTEEKKE